MIRVYVSILGVHAAGDYYAFTGAQDGGHYAGVSWAIIGHPLQGLKYTASLYLMVILSDDPLLTAHVPGGEDSLKVYGVISLFR